MPQMPTGLPACTIDETGFALAPIGGGDELFGVLDAIEGADGE